MLGVTFGTKHSYNDFGLILADTNIGPAEPILYKVQVPGRNGLVDLTESITPRVRFNERIITYTFNTVGYCNWQQKMREVGSYLQGQKMHVIDDSDPLWYWEGDIVINNQSSSEDLGTIIIQVNAYPFKFKTTETEEEITGDGTLTCTNGRMEVHPTVTCNEECTLTFGNKTITLEAGTHLIAEFEFIEGDNEVEVESEGTTTITYREGAL